MGNFNIRKLVLFAVDSLVIWLVCAVFTWLANLGVDSIVINDDVTFLKVFAMYICLMLARKAGHVYSNVWRYANSTTYLSIAVSDMIGGVIYIAIGRVVDALNLGFAFSIILMLIICLITLSSRFAYQYLYALGERRHDLVALGSTGKNRVNIAIVGAGNVGASLADEIKRNLHTKYNPVCFVDNNEYKVGNKINGINIIKEDESVIDELHKLNVQEIVIAIPDTDGENRKRLYELYKESGCKIKLYDYPMYDGKKIKSKRALREFQIEDLLFRDSIMLDNTVTKLFYHDKVVMVTGGGGSIGSELCRQIAMTGPKKLIIVDIYENNAYEIQQELIRKYGETLDLEVAIASVRDEKRMEEIFRINKPQLVFHAAAHKHVPLMEHSACEAIKNNVMGTYNVANLSEKYEVEKFLLISTDKAVNPTNVMGASKRLCEMVVQCRTDSKTEFTAVRFGNVLGSNGSVIPLFKRQIAEGGPITLTDKRIIRYFMTIPEAVGLVMETCRMARDGELFVLDMGKPVKIIELAENMIKLSGLRPYKDIDIVEIGLRPGEKLYEELLMKAEELDKTDNKLIFIERGAGLKRQEVEAKLRILNEAVASEGYDNIIAAIKATVPTYHSPEEVNKVASESNEMKLARTQVAATVS